jgi:hypothetical protein
MDTTTDKKTAAPEPVPAPRNLDQLVPVLNRSDAKMYSIAITERKAQQVDAAGAPVLSHREVTTIKLHPGVNYVRMGDLIDAGVDKTPVMFAGMVEVADPTVGPVTHAIELANKTHSKSALIEWAKKETRPDVLAAIAARAPKAKAN